MWLGRKMSFLCPQPLSTRPLSGAVEFCVPHSWPPEEKEHIGLPPRPLGTVAPCTVPFFCGPSYTGPGSTCYLEMAPNANLRQGTPQCLDDRANVSWLFLLFSLQNEIMCQLRKKKKKERIFVFFFKYILDNSVSDECPHILWTRWRPGDVVDHEKLQRTGLAGGWGEGPMMPMSLSLSSHHLSKNSSVFLQGIWAQLLALRRRLKTGGEQFLLFQTALKHPPLLFWMHV